MKKLILFLIITTMFLTACSATTEDEASVNTSDQEQSSQESSSTEVKEESESLEVDKGIFNVSITIPASIFSEEQDVKAEADKYKEDKEIEAMVNEDGSMTLKMSKSKHKELMGEMEESLIESYKEYIDSDDFSSIENVQYKDNFKKLIVEVNKEKYEQGLDSLAVWSAGISTAMYHLYDGVPPEEINVEIQLQDSDTGTTFDTVIYPEDFETE